MLLNGSEMRFHGGPVAASNRTGELEAVVYRASHQRKQRFWRSSCRLDQLSGRAIKRHQEIRGDRGAGVIEHAAVFTQVERRQAERIGQPAAALRGLRRFSCHGAPRSVELCGAAIEPEGLKGMQPESPFMRRE